MHYELCETAFSFYTLGIEYTATYYYTRSSEFPERSSPNGPEGNMLFYIFPDVRILLELQFVLFIWCCCFYVMCMFCVFLLCVCHCFDTHKITYATWSNDKSCFSWRQNWLVSTKHIFSIKPWNVQRELIHKSARDSPHKVNTLLLLAPLQHLPAFYIANEYDCNKCWWPGPGCSQSTAVK